MTKKQKIVLGLCVPIAIAEIILLIIFSVILASPPHEQRDFTFIDRETLLMYCPKVALPSKESEEALGEAEYRVQSSSGAFVTELKEEVSDVYAIYYNHLGRVKAQFYKVHSFNPSLEEKFDETFFVTVTEKMIYQDVEIAIQKISLKEEIEAEVLEPQNRIFVSFAIDGRVYRMEYAVESDFESEQGNPLSAMKSVIDVLIEKGVIV